MPWKIPAEFSSSYALPSFRVSLIVSCTSNSSCHVESQRKLLGEMSQIDGFCGGWGGERAGDDWNVPTSRARQLHCKQKPPPALAVHVSQWPSPWLWLTFLPVENAVWWHQSGVTVVNQKSCRLVSRRSWFRVGFKEPTEICRNLIKNVSDTVYAA